MTNEQQLARDLERLVGDDDRTHELGVRVRVLDGRLVVEGQVASEERRRGILDVLEEEDTGLVIVDRLSLSAEPVSGGHEQITPPSAQ